MESILFHSDRVWVAENASNGNMQAKFVLCDFGVNGNGVRLNRGTIESWMGSLINQPLVGKIVRGVFGDKEDFAGHQMRKTYVKDDLGNMTQVVSFDTNAYGVFVDVGIETVDGVECLVATAEIWDRYPKTVRLIKDRIASGTLHTSWEITVNACTYGDDGVKTIDDGVFTALAMLGQRVRPAYDSSRLLEVAEADVDDELVSAMQEDMEEKMEKDMIPEAETAEIETEEPVVSQAAEVEAQPEVVPEDTAESETVAETAQNEPQEDTVAEGPENAEEVASLTTEDLRRKLSKACAEKLGFDWVYVSFVFPEEHTAWAECPRRESELDYVLFVYTVEGDEVTVDDGTPVKLAVSIASINDTLAEKDAAIAAALADAAALRAQVDELSQIKAEYDKIMADRAKAELAAKREELRAYAMDSGMFTEGELAKGNAKKLIDALDQAGINQMIADRYMAKIKESKAATTVETSEVHTPVSSVDLTTEDVKPVRANIVRAYIED